MTNTDTTRRVDVQGDPVAEAEAARAQLQQTKEQRPAPHEQPSHPPTDTPDGGERGDDRTPEPVRVDLLGGDEEGDDGDTDLAEQIEAQLDKNGKLSDYFKEKLAKERKLPKSVIETLEAGAVAKRMERVQDFVKTVGQDFAKVQEWAKANLDLEQREYLTRAAFSSNKQEQQTAALALRALYLEATSGPGSRQLDGGPAPAPYTGPNIASTEDMLKVLGDPRARMGGAAGAEYAQERKLAAARYADLLGIPVRTIKK